MYKKTIRSFTIFFECNGQQLHNTTPKPNYVNFAFLKSYSSNDICTKFVVRLPNEKQEIKNAKNLNDIRKFVTFGCKIKMIVEFNSVWHAKDRGTIGSNFRILRLDVIPVPVPVPVPIPVPVPVPIPVKKNNYKIHNIIDDLVFLESDDNDGEKYVIEKIDDIE
jgi:hypothetical protein